MKKVISKLFFGLLAFLIAFFIGICVIFLLPLDYIKYKRSLYYKKEHKKYRLFAASGNAFEIYNEILKNQLPITYVPNPKDDSLDCGWFLFENTLIIHSIFSFEFDTDNKEWNYWCEDEEEKRIIMPLAEYIENEIQEANKLSGKIICNDAAVLIDGNCIDNVDAAKSEARFLIYNDDREEVLKGFCNREANGLSF